MRGFCIRMEFCFTKKSKDGCETTTSVHNSHQITSHLTFLHLDFPTKNKLCGFWQLIVHLYLRTCDLVEFLAHKCVKRKPWLRQALQRLVHVGNAAWIWPFQRPLLFSHHSDTQSYVFYILKSYKKDIVYIYVICMHVYYITIYMYIQLKTLYTILYMCIWILNIIIIFLHCVAFSA